MSERLFLRRARVYRIYPTPAQAEYLEQQAGAVRFVYNLALEQRRTYWRRGRSFNHVTQGRELGELREYLPWLAAVARSPLEAALRDLDRAHQNWWSGRARAPDFRRRGVNDSFRLKGREVVVRRTGRASGMIRLPKIGYLRLRWSGTVPGEIRNATVSKRGGNWFVAVATRREADPTVSPIAPSVGIDRGVAVFAALSTGELIQGPNVGRKAASALAKARCRLDRKAKGSNNRRKARLRVARLHKRVSDARKDFLHKVSTNIAKSHGVVVLEDLKVRNMTASAAGTLEEPGRNVRQKAGLNRAILDQGWGMFREMLAYKLEERGGYLLTVDPKNTSRTCSECGVVDADSRDGAGFACQACGHTAHADTNAAINILRRGTPCMPVEVI